MMMMMTMTIMMMSQRRRRQSLAIVTPCYLSQFCKLYLSMYLFIYLFIYLSIYPCIYCISPPNKFCWNHRTYIFSSIHPSTHLIHLFLCSVRAVVLLVISRRELPDIITYSHQMIKPTMVASPSSLLIDSHHLMLSVVISMIILIMKESDVFQDLLGIWLWDFKHLTMKARIWYGLMICDLIR